MIIGMIADLVAAGRHSLQKCRVSVQNHLSENKEGRVNALGFECVQKLRRVCW